MPLRNSENRYGLVAMSLHWLTAALFLAQIGIGIAMTTLPITDPRTFSLYQTHKSFGVTLMVLALLRLGWRLVSPAPALPQNMPLWQHHAALATHFGLYFALIAMPLLGWVIVSASPYGIPTVLFGVVELPHLSFVVMSPHKAMLGSIASWAHWGLAWTASLLIFGHVAAAMAHHFYWRDDILRRMLPERARFLLGQK